MKLTLYRDSGGQDSTLGRLCIGQGASEYLVAYTLEDQRQIVKVQNETRIPSGTYEIKLRQGSPMASRYDAAYSDIDHSGMLWLQDVPNFEFIYLHVGNDDDDSSGCILVGCNANIDIVHGGGTLGRSKDAYKSLYKKIQPTILAGEKVFITIKDEGIK